MIDTILVFLLNFIDYHIAFLSIADIAVAILIIKAHLAGVHITISRRHAVLICMLLLFSVLSFLVNVNKAYFKLADFIISFVKMLFYIYGILMIPKYLAKKKINLKKILECYLIIAVVGAIIQIGIVQIFGRYSWPLYSLGGQYFGLLTENTMFVNTGLMRARSFYSEPANLAVHLSMIYAILLYDEEIRKHWILHIMYILGIICANSVSGYGIMVGIYIIYFVDLKNRKRFKNMIKFVTVGVIFGSLLIVRNDYLRNRVISLFNLKDQSGVVRTIGGFYFLKYIPFCGVGAGNHANYYNSLKSIEQMWFSGSGEFYNVILLSIISIGYLGALVFILYQWEILKGNKKVFFMLMLTHFGWGKLWTAPTWIFLMICSYADIKRLNIRKEK